MMPLLTGIWVRVFPPRSAPRLDLPLVQQVRLRLLDELGRLTAAEVDCGDLGLRLGGACLTGLHFHLTATGTPEEIARWLATAQALLAEAAPYGTPHAQRIFLQPTAARIPGSGVAAYA